MDYQALFQRILKTVDTTAYFTPSEHVDPKHREGVAAVQRALSQPGFDADEVRLLVERLHQQGKLDRVLRASSLHIIAAHPQVAEWEEAARLVGEQEFAALELGGPHLQRNLASVERHRGVLAFLRGHYDVALDYFARALERERSSENLTNILCTLLRLGEEGEARELLESIRTAFPEAIASDVERSIQSDPDLALLRTEASS
jgi:tetratricopeptide (TPR) repeat protein